MGQTKFWVNFFWHESSNWVKIGLHAENQLPGWSGSGLKVCRVVVVGGGLEPIIESHQLWLSWVMVELGFDKNYVGKMVHGFQYCMVET